MKVVIATLAFITLTFSMTFEEYQQQNNEQFEAYKKGNFSFKKEKSLDKSETNCQVTATITEEEKTDIKINNSSEKGYFSTLADSVTKKANYIGFETDEIQVETGLIPSVEISFKLSDKKVQYDKALEGNPNFLEKKILKMLIDSHQKVTEYNKTSKWKVDMVYLSIGLPPSVKWSYKNK